jgi:hypothetical protein
MVSIFLLAILNLRVDQGEGEGQVDRIGFSAGCLQESQSDRVNATVGEVLLVESDVRFFNRFDCVCLETDHFSILSSEVAIQEQKGLRFVIFFSFE